ncbi:MAG: ABC transporter permease [Deltaproteobacteria bacterium]|nr:ABC transporter permease [Deltaproteobacteria bacterium]
MSRLLAILVGVSALAVAFAAALARAGVETRYYTLVSGQLFVVILLVVLVSSVFTLLYLLAFGRLGRRFIADRFPVFVGWTMLRSHRVTPTPRSRLAHAWHAAASRGRGPALRDLVVACVLGAAALVLGTRTPWNTLAGALSPEFVLVLRVVCLSLAAYLLARAAVATMGGRGGEPPIARLRARTAVTLPTFISIVGVSIGIWALIVVLSVMHGFEEDLRDKILRTNAHIVVEPEDAAGVIGDPFEAQDAVRGVAGVIEANAYVHGEVMMASSTNIAVNVIIKGIDPDALARSEQLAGRVSPGDIHWLDAPEALMSDRARYPLVAEQEYERAHALDDDGVASGGLGRTRRPPELLPGVLLGAELAVSLNADVGSEVQIISPDGDVGPTGLRPKLKSFRVAGIATTGMYEYDQKLAWMALDDAQRFFGMGADLNRLEVRLVSAEETDAAVEAIRERLGPSLLVTDWKTRNKSLFSALALERVVMFIVLGFIILVASLLIVSSLVMLVVEKSRDIAILKALGASHRGVVRTFLVIGGVIGVIGSASGVTLGVATSLAIEHLGVPLPDEYYISSLPVQLDALEVSLVALAAFGICLLATLYPSREAAAMSPVEGLRHG